MNQGHIVTIKKSRPPAKEERQATNEWARDDKQIGAVRVGGD
ncbi:hypothetical protein AACH06_29400 [Ideonella sp. DXS29W]|uniref:Uncharacterized protein n=1 Tax=Ideonella lacteola TaxID=2984193 RepID=A0ABU9BYL1_9BURK